MACQILTWNWNWFLIPRVRARRRPRPSNAPSTPSGTRHLDCKLKVLHPSLGGKVGLWATGDWEGPLPACLSFSPSLPPSLLPFLPSSLPSFLPLHLQFCIASQVKIGTFFIYSIENVSDVGEWKILWCVARWSQIVGVALGLSKHRMQPIGCGDNLLRAVCVDDAGPAASHLLGALC